MFDEPEESRQESARDPKERAQEKVDEFRMHAELAAVFEGCRKFGAELLPKLSADIARDLQRTVGRLEKAKVSNTPVIGPESALEAAEILNHPARHDLSTNDYHIYRRPGEVMMARWLEGDQVENFYARLQAHFDAAMEGYKEDERQASEWKQDAKTQGFLAALDAVEVKMAERYLREVIRHHSIFVLSTQTADELNIAYLADTLMGMSAEEIVGTASAPGDEPTEAELAWFYKLFALRGLIEGVERMCFFMYLQKTDDTF